jgi:outer membrane protein OmpA-like peptidoglycan-associated protein
MRPSVVMCLAVLATFVSSPFADACKVKEAKGRRMARARPPIDRPVESAPVETSAPVEAATPVATPVAPTEAEPAEAKPVEARPVEAKPESPTEKAVAAPRPAGKLHSDVGFARGQMTLDDTSKKKLDQVAAFLVSSPDVRLSIEGHADASGSTEANQTLSERRADAVKEYLESKGVPSDRLSTIGYGETKPKYAPMSARNRRAALVQQ